VITLKEQNNLLIKSILIVSKKNLNYKYIDSYDEATVKLFIYFFYCKKFGFCDNNLFGFIFFYEKM
jgi:hypothetical protein